MWSRRREPAGLGAEYEKLVHEPSRRDARVRAFKAASFVYRLASWLLSLVVVFLLWIFSFAIAAAFVSSGWAVLASFIVLGLLVWRMRRSWRRYRAPLIRLVPRSDYHQFVAWQRTQADEPQPAERRKWKLDLRVVKRG